MRWNVEVSSIGKTDKQRYCVETESWQRALQAARGLRGDPSPMTGFSIELLDSGFSAVDPVTRFRYFITRAPDDAPLTAPTASVQQVPAKPPSASTAPPGPAAKAPISTAPPQSAKVVPRPSSGSTPPKKANLSKTFVFGSTGAALFGDDKKSGPSDPSAAAPVAPKGPAESPPAAAKPPAPVRSEPPRATDSVKSISPAAAGTPATPRAPESASMAELRPIGSSPTPAPPAPAAAPAVATTPPAALEPPLAVAAPVASAPTLPGIDVLFKREQDPDAHSPLSYREYVYFFPAASNEAMAKAMLVAQFDLVKTSLEGARPGKLINLAMFDVSFTGKPPAPPVVTLTWKDWKGEPIIDFPRRATSAPAELREQPIPLVSRTSQGEPKSADAISPPANAKVEPERRGFPPPRSAPVEPAASAPVASSVASAPLLAAAPDVAVAPKVEQLPATFAPSPIAAGKRPGAKPNIRARGDELIADLFEAMHDLHFLRDSIEGADFCLTLALEKIPSRVGIVHLYDIDRREFVVACMRAPGHESALGQRYPESDPILFTAMRRQHAMVFPDTNGANELSRYRALGGAKSLVVAPVILGGRFLGALELMDPVDGSPFAEDEEHALSYIAEQFAEFVATRGVTVDPDRIAASARAP